MSQVSDTSFGLLRETMRGQVITSDSPEYDAARKVWNGDIDRYPAAIARCTSVADIQAALAFAQSNGLRLAIKSGGHSFPGHSVADGCLMLDLRPMNQVTIDPETRRAVVQGGAIWSEVDGPAQQHGLAVTGGHVSHTGVAGLTLGGGMGHLMRKLGLTVDNLLAAEIVTADGKILRASATDHPELFWAIRGGGGNFGVATRFEFQLSPIGPTVLSGLAFWAPEQGPELMKRYREITTNCPDDVSTLFVYLHAPPFDFVPKDVQLKPGYALVVCGTDLPTAENAIHPLRSSSQPLFDIIGPMPYLAVQGMFDPALPHGTKCYLKSHYVRELTDDLMKIYHQHTAKMPPGMSQMFTIQLGGKLARVPADATAVGGRDAQYLLMIVGIWEDEAQKPAVVSWVRDFHQALEPFQHGAYVNLSDEQDEKSLERTYGAETYARLRRVKKQYDPNNVFNLNQNIKPA